MPIPFALMMQRYPYWAKMKVFVLSFVISRRENAVEYLLAAKPFTLTVTMEALVPCGGSDSWTSLSKQLTLVPWMGTFLWTFTVSLLLGMGSSAPTRYQGLTNNSLPYGSKPAQHSQSSQQFISNSFHNDGEQYHNLRKYGKLGREVVANGALI
ncbi:unnamed protein product [Cyprideis torosa]|uniref:Uncharacterized protein n=1 Tax=Cyprideis torosa TaxID=163714 RepID=A0A7R8W4Z9_9CRUS|nr:unnamed protein product [Cyprideis torosa]CAG0884745.1 unnamed protein product [Cyprideis torosa]